MMKALVLACTHKILLHYIQLYSYKKMLDHQQQMLCHPDKENIS